MGILDLLQFKSKYIVPLSSFVSLSLSLFNFKVSFLQLEVGMRFKPLLDESSAKGKHKCFGHMGLPV